MHKLIFFFRNNDVVVGNILFLPLCSLYLQFTRGVMVYPRHFITISSFVFVYIMTNVNSIEFLC